MLCTWCKCLLPSGTLGHLLIILLTLKHIGILNWLLPFEGWRWLKSLPSKFHLECCVVTSAPHTETADPPLQHFLLHTSREGAESTEIRISLLKELKRESWRMNVKYKGRYSAIEYRMHAGKQLTHSGDDNHFTTQGIQHKTWDPLLMIQCHAMASKRRSALLSFDDSILSTLVIPNHGNQEIHEFDCELPPSVSRSLKNAQGSQTSRPNVSS